ncbi:peptidase [Nitrosopumilus sp. K4]|uniref:peptidase n=1 Tax=Nitrosopumilus sp. K4 TaxID=2795383 RepID=UPI001BA81924|nr:peptidase [Nitrosopumilus sp. K4]QUC65705.1 peptidase [Nitrosopumilus sp. K4]
MAIPLIAVLIFGSFSMPLASAQFQAGGVDKEGSWYAGEGLKQGDFFRYSMCHVDYKECATFEMDFWIKGDRQVGTEDKWVAEVVVYDGNKVVHGEIELGKVAPEPTGGSTELGVYRGAFKSSIAWLSAFATSYGAEGGEGPKKWTAKSWGKIGNIGGEQVIPTALETITIKSGTWDTVLITWKTGGYSSKVWLVDDFPFPIKASTLTHVSEGIPPPEYKFELLEYKENVSSSPFEGIVSTADKAAAMGCPVNYEKTQSIKKHTKNFSYQIHAFYGPENPQQGCSMQWLIKFISIYDDTEFLNQVQYDFLRVDENLKPLRSIAQDEGRQFLYSPSGQSLIDMVVDAEPGTARYVVWVYGLAPEGVVPSTPDDYLIIEVPIFAGEGSTTIPPVITPPAQNIPAWIKNNAGWWAEGAIDDNSFVQGIQFLIKEGIMKIPPTTQGAGSGSNEIPAWIKNNAGWWAEGAIDDNSFVQGIQFLIKEGIMKISS